MQLFHPSKKRKQFYITNKNESRLRVCARNTDFKYSLPKYPISESGNKSEHCTTRLQYELVSLPLFPLLTSKLTLK